MHEKQDYPSDEDIFKLIADNKQQGFNQLYEKYVDQIINYAFYLIGDRHRAEEIAQEAFLRAYRDIENFRADSKISTWVYTIVRNLAYNWLKHHKYEPKVSIDQQIDIGNDEVALLETIDDSSLGPDEIASKKEIEALVKKAISALPAKYRDVIVLCDLHELSYKKAADILRCDPKAVGMRLMRARRELAKILKID